MPDLDKTLRELSGLGGRPPSTPRDLSSVRERARSIRRRRWSTVASPMVILMAVMAAVALWGDRDGGEDAVAVEPPTTLPAPAAEAGDLGPIRVVPAEGLVDGALVEVELDEDPGGPLVVMQCAFAPRSERDAAGRCNDEVSLVRVGESGPLDPVAVTRYQQRGRGYVYDCAHPTWRCYLVVAPGTPNEVDFGRAVHRPIRFVDDGREPAIVLSSDRPANGEVITISGSALPRNSQLWIVQCLPDESRPDIERCDSLRGKAVATDGAGRFETRFQVSEVIRPWSEWDEEPCRSCAIRIAVGHVSVQVDLEVRPSLEPVRPQFEIVEEGPFTPGQPVTVIGRGFQIELESDYEKPYPEWCILGTDPPVCGSPGASYERVDIGGGEYLYEGFPMPHGQFGERCLTERCVVTWIRGAGTPPAAIANIDLVPG